LRCAWSLSIYLSLTALRRMNEKYGIKDPVLKIEQRQERNFSSDQLDQTPNTNNYDLEFSPTGQVLEETVYTYGGSVYRLTRHEYDDAGRLFRKKMFDKTGAETEVSELVYSPGACSWVTRDTAGSITSRGVSEYSGENLVLTSSCDAQDRRRTLKTFDYSNNKLARSDSRYFLPDGTLSERWLSDYDAEGRILKTYGLMADGSPLGDGKYSYEYNDVGRESKIWTFNEFEDDEVAKGVTIYEYVNDERGNWIERREFHRWRNQSDHSKTITRRKVTYFT
jgi:hypothetical protein